jgi:hypothetical protein
MLGLGRYSQHRKLNTSQPEKAFSDDDEDDLHVLCGTKENDVHQVLYLGEECIPHASEKDYPMLVKRIYGEKFSPLNALTQCKKLNLKVGESGITVTSQSSGKSFDAIYEVPDIAFVSTDSQHKKVLAVVCRGRLGDVKLSVFVCQNEDVPVDVMHECVQRVSKKNMHRNIMEIKRLFCPSALSFVYEPVLKESSSSLTSTSLRDPSAGFEGFQTVGGTSNPLTNTTIDSDLDDEFSQLALKRNVHLPDHMQNKTVESAFLMQEPDASQTKHEISNTDTVYAGNHFFPKTNFFSSSYSRVSTGS